MHDDRNICLKTGRGCAFKTIFDMDSPECDDCRLKDVEISEETSDEIIEAVHQTEKEEYRAAFWEAYGEELFDE